MDAAVDRVTIGDTEEAAVVQEMRDEWRPG
jgi:hypothetical protein